MVIPQRIEVGEVWIGRSEVHGVDVHEGRSSRTHQAWLERGVEMEAVGLESGERGDGVHLGVGHEVAGQHADLGPWFGGSITADRYDFVRGRVDERSADPQTPGPPPGPCLLEHDPPGLG